MDAMLLALLLVVGAPVAETDARAFVDKWLAAQNAGDFAAYEKLFAYRFTGIRRSGPRTARFDRAGWMRDRARMFGKPMTVGISDVKIRTGGASARVSFKQTFAQGNFKDVGSKQLVIVREAGALKVASEKMVRSLIESAPVPADERFRFVVSGGVLLSDSPDEGWATGAPQYEPGDPTVAARRVDAAKLPPALAGWQGRRMRLMTAQGSACDAKIKGFRVLSRSIPHFGTVQEWKEMKTAEVAQQAWDLGTKVLVAEVDKDCKGRSGRSRRRRPRRRPTRAKRRTRRLGRGRSSSCASPTRGRRSRRATSSRPPRASSAGTTWRARARRCACSTPVGRARRSSWSR